MCRPASSFLVLRQILLTYEHNQRPTNCQLTTKMPFLEPDFIDYSTTIIIIRQNSGQSSDQNRTWPSGTWSHWLVGISAAGRRQHKQQLRQHLSVIIIVVVVVTVVVADDDDEVLRAGRQVSEVAIRTSTVLTVWCHPGQYARYSSCGRRTDRWMTRPRWTSTGLGLRTRPDCLSRCRAAFPHCWVTSDSSCDLAHHYTHTWNNNLKNKGNSIKPLHFLLTKEHSVLRTFCVIKFSDILPNNFSPIPHTSLPTV